MGISSCVGSAASRYILKNRKTHKWSKNALKNSKQGRVGIIRQNVGGGACVMYAGRVVKIECSKVKFECSKVRFK